MNVKWHQTLTVLSSKYIVLDKKSIPIVAYMVQAETQSVRCESYRFVLQEHSFGKEVNPNCGLVSRQTDTTDVHTLCDTVSCPAPFKKLIFFFQIGSGHEIMYDTLYASRKHLYNGLVHKQSQNGPYIEGMQQSTNLVGIVKAVIHKSCNE